MKTSVILVGLMLATFTTGCSRVYYDSAQSLPPPPTRVEVVDQSCIPPDFSAGANWGKAVGGNVNHGRQFDGVKRPYYGYYGYGGSTTDCYFRERSSSNVGTGRYVGGGIPTWPY